MKTHKPKRTAPTRDPESRQPAPAQRRRWWPALAGCGAALAASLLAYSPALSGEFVFDDLYLPFQQAEFAHAPLSSWLRGVRPVLMFSYWINNSLSGLDPFSYHLMNVLLHALAGVLVFLVVRRVLEMAGVTEDSRRWIAFFGAGVFLLHPLQTESVAYVASRSELLSVMLFHASLAAFVYRRRQTIGWLGTFGVLALFGASVLTKEHTAVLPAVLLLTDYYFNPGFSLKGIKGNWRLYGLMAAGAAAAGSWVLGVLRTSDTAGFKLPEATWYEYFFTQGRVIWTYLRLFVLPVGLNADHDVPFSRSLLDGGAGLGLAALAVLAVLAWLWRKRYPLASYGYLVFLALLAPTSSVVPIWDPIAERRMYLPMLGLLFVLAEPGRRWIQDRRVQAGAGAVLAVLLLATFARSQVWSSAEALWTDSAAKSPNRFRTRVQLGQVYFAQGRCAEAEPEFTAAARYAPKPDYGLLVNWGLTYDCLKQPDQAIEKLKAASRLMSTPHVWAVMGMVHGKAGRNAEALAALDAAQRLNPGYPLTYLYRGAVYASSGRFAEAAEQYRRAVQLAPRDESARAGLAFVEGKLASSGR